MKPIVRVEYLLAGVLRGGLIAAALLSQPISASHAQQLFKIRSGGGTKAITPLVIDHVIPEYLGWFRQEGITVEAVPLGSDAAMEAALDSGNVEVIDAVPSFQLPMAAKGQPVRAVDFFEYTYPFKWSMAVKPGSPIKSLADLRGKKIGVISLGVSDYPVGRAVMRVAGLDPDKDVSWLAVGEGVTAGIAVERGDVDALYSIDTIFGTIEAAGIGLSYLPLPTNIPRVGGIYLAALPEFIRDHRAQIVGFGRGVAKAQVFIQENPEAAAYIFAKMYPEALPKGKSLEEQVKAIEVPLIKRMKIYHSYDPAAPWGSIKESEWQDEIKFWGVQDKIKSTANFYTNDLIAEINNFDENAVKAEARNFKLPYKQ